MSKIQFSHSFEEIISLENLLEAWGEFVCGKRKRKDVQEFEKNLMSNLIILHKDLATSVYKHSNYTAFNIADPKPRSIHKALVRDRVLHHALYRKLYPFFDRTFIADSFSCRINKGTHKAVSRFNTLATKVSHNNTRTCWVLKCDIRKFFASIDHSVLLVILSEHISDLRTMLPLQEVIESFSVTEGTGLPLGNLTSQIFCNIYMNKFDQFVKHKLKAKYYIRYADDFVFMSENCSLLEAHLSKISNFLFGNLKLSLHPKKVSIQSYASGVDFLGWVNFPTHKVLRTVTKNRMFRRIKKHPKENTIQSYLGLLSHGNGYILKNEIESILFPKLILDKNLKF